ncbi:hypothetical protein BCR32DRAFT_287162 [Anaeromyces robustus]|uniref:Uncharacterized protein n=1 Tax=Anaeromyces robustus TaxID=1754192 RepID=A0A1Y1VSQ2_9FUNG|nr:hypothetical protein BCR32DRAFT_287162 [Anaeromyces robustus]|eukprot:ORX64320.1 hypothetical protein BCR32DRAFT_287162 [Anaeromyces robustus]
MDIDSYFEYLEKLNDNLIDIKWDIEKNIISFKNLLSQKRIFQFKYSRVSNFLKKKLVYQSNLKFNLLNGLTTLGNYDSMKIRNIVNLPMKNNYNFNLLFNFEENLPELNVSDKGISEINIIEIIILYFEYKEEEIELIHQNYINLNLNIQIM